jgi:signal transduction histidine kinase/CheY-like chemotaxis protein
VHLQKISLPMNPLMTAPAPLPRDRPSFALALSVCLGATLLMVWLRLVVFDDRILPLSSSVPLLLCLWARDTRLLYGMALVFSISSVAKVLWILPEGQFPSEYQVEMLVSHFINIWLVVGVIHGLLKARTRLEKKNEELNALNAALDASNHELSASNEELAAREEEISRQNEELQSQTEELEQQAEELRQQAEEMEQQGAEIQEANNELVRKERGMQTLLDSGRWLRGGINELMVTNGICQAAVQVLGEDVQAAAVVVSMDGRMALKGDFGFGVHGSVMPEQRFENSFAALVLDSRRTAAIEDTSARPDVKLPRSGIGPPFRAVLGTPIWQGGEPTAVLEVYSTNPREWTEHEFRIIEWLASQAALALETVFSQQKLEQKRIDAEEASIQKTRFLAAVSHDVRTPANAISLLAEFIEKCAGDPARQHQIPALAKNLWSNARAMVDLVSDVLDLTRLDSGHFDLDVAEFSLNELIRAEAGQAMPLADRKGLDLKFKLPEHEVRVASDRTKLARVISNLVSNAIKFTEAGEVRVECSPREDGGVSIHVVDTGIGIPSENLGHVFDEFFQLKNPERNREKGAGLGLAICQRLLKGLGFMVKVKSVIGKGSTFSVEIPPDRVVVRELCPEEDTPTGTMEDPLEGMSILLVEDHQVAREMTAQLLTAEGARVTTAASGKEAVRMLSSGDYQALLLDLNLPDFDGSEILKRLQVIRPPSLRWVLVVSGDVRPERVAEVKSLGAHCLIPKPVCVEKIRSAIVAGAPASAASPASN